MSAAASDWTPGRVEEYESHYVIARPEPGRWEIVYKTLRLIPRGAGEVECVDPETNEYLATVKRVSSGRWLVADDGGPSRDLDPNTFDTRRAALIALERYWRAL